MDAVMARRRRSRIHATEAAHRRRRSSSSSAPLDSLPDDVLEAILLRLPRQPSSRPRASAVSRRWRGIVTNPMFHRRFHAHHRKPPVLGVFERRRKFIITPVLAAPDRIPAERLSISRWMTSRDCDATGCRHGRVLAIHRLLPRLVVFAPLTGEERNLPVVPDEFRECNYHHGAVLCAASGKEDHVHGFCHESPFKVAFLSRYPTRNRFITSVYSSESGTWGGLKEIEAPFKVALVDVPATLVGNVLYWMLSSDNVCAAMLEFDLDTQSLAVIKGPSDMNYSGSHRIIKIEQGTVSWLRFKFPILEIWLRQKNCHGLATWLQHKTVDMHDILGIPPRVSKKWHQKILGYEEDSNVIILYVDDSAYMLDLNSMKSTKLDESRLMNSCHPFTSFYPPDMAI
ncbi:F-box protein At5g07610-like [Triticum dicoccoides]|uniref:F-box protein At5g07610-like n=1 Tax=Triticum dicoccoides TaxID=85692 RepID=UPI0012336B42|nr:F-box protein At5g07610-like [Triticum dicoccoides]